MTTRRDVLRAGFGLGALALVPDIRFARAEGGGEDPRVLVVVELSGGNDGLSTVVPYEDDHLGRARSTTRIPDGELWKLEDGVGLHPGLAPLKPAWDAGALAIVEGAGYPQPNRSHFASMDIWHTGRLEGRRADTGWVGGAADEREAGGRDAATVHIGTTVPYSLRSRRVAPIAFEAAAAYRWFGRGDELKVFEALQQRDPTLGDGAPENVWLGETAREALASSDAVRRAAAAYRPAATYPRQGALGRQLSVVAALVAADFPARVYSVSLGGFDTHSGQRARHDGLMRQLGGSLAAFQEDLEKHGVAERVVVVTFSEFGRRVKENGSAGTDHGTAGPMFLLGPAVRGGRHGAPPRLDALDGGGDLVMTTDFRAVYATLLDRWLDVPHARVLGETFTPLPVLA